MKHLLMTGTIGAILLAPAAFGSDVTGKWTAEFETPRGVSELEFNLKVEGDKVTGTVSSRRGESDIQDGKITGDEISFKQVMNFGREITILYTARFPATRLSLNEPSSVRRAGEGQEGEDGADPALEAPEAPIGSHKPKETDLRPMAVPESRAARDAGDAARAAADGAVR